MFRRNQPNGMKETRGIAKSVVALAAGSLLAVAAGNAQALDGEPADGDGAIGGRVWSDLNVDGLQDDGEPGIAGVVVNLEVRGMNPNGNYRWDPLLTTTTASDGTYGFEDLDAGLFRIHVEKPSDQCTFSPFRAGPASIDSDVRPDSARSFGTSPSAEDPTIFNWDAGLGCPAEATPTIAEDDTVSGRVGRTLVVDILGNDSPSDGIDSILILSSDVPGTVKVSDSNNIVISDTTEKGTFTIEYKLTSTSTSMDTAIVTVELTKKRRGGCFGRRGFGYRGKIRDHIRDHSDRTHWVSKHKFNKKHYDRGSKVHYGRRGR